MRVEQSRDASKESVEVKAIACMFDVGHTTWRRCTNSRSSSRNAHIISIHLVFILATAASIVLPATMPSTSLLRSSLPSTSKSASSPRVSSPLATHSSSIDSQSDGADEDDDDSESDASSSDDSDDDQDNDAELSQFLASAKENVRRRTATLSADADSARAGPSVNLEDADLMHEHEECVHSTLRLLVFRN